MTPSAPGTAAQGAQPAATPSTVSAERKEQLRRLVGERDTLVGTGVYSADDAVIRNLDGAIAALLQHLQPAGA